MRNVEQPSTRAASTSSSEMAWTAYWRIMNTPNPHTSAGPITALSSPFQPILTISMYSGIRPSWTGTIIVAITTSSSALRPRNRNLANANPASVANITTATVTTLETTSEFTRPYANAAWSFSNTRLMLSPRSPPGTSGGGTSLTASFERVAMTNIQ